MTFESLSHLDCRLLFWNKDSKIACAQWLHNGHLHIKNNRRSLQGPSAKGSLKFKHILTSISQMDHLIGHLMRLELWRGLTQTNNP